MKQQKIYKHDQYIGDQDHGGAGCQAKKASTKSIDINVTHWTW